MKTEKDYLNSIKKILQTNNKVCEAKISNRNAKGETLLI